MFQVKLFSSLVKVFSDEEPRQTETTGHSVLKNEKTSFQIAYCGDENCAVTVSAKSNLGDAVKLYSVKEINSCLAASARQDEYTVRREAGMFPELLLPANQSLRPESGKWQSVWVEVSSEQPLPIGAHNIKITFSNGEKELASANYTLTVIDAELPKQKLIYTNWFHTDCLATHYKVDIFSEDYWRIVENYLKLAVDYGMNMVLTPLFTPPLDTKVGGERPTVQLVDVKKDANGYRFSFEKLDRWIAMCEAVGVEYYEISHLFTQWGAKHAPKIIADVKGKQKKIFGWSTKGSGKRYVQFLESFAAALKKYLAEKGISKRCYFHVSDEPNKMFLRPYSKAAEIVKRNFGEFPIVDALSDFEFYKRGLVELPIPANDHIDDFIGKVPELWAYYCSAQNTKCVSNRFFNMPSQRNRVLGYQMYKYDVKGFLHWGYNYWYTRLSRGQVDPFTVTDAGGYFPAGDSYVVYPGEDGKPLSSLRLKVFYDALQDMRALELLESKIGREKTVELLESEGKITFSEYPHSDEWQLKIREKINQKIAEAAK